MVATRSVITLKELRRAYAEVLEHLESSLGEEIDLSQQDLFWTVEFDEAFNLESDPPLPGVGQTSESVDYLHRTLEEGGRLPYEAVWLSQIMLAVASAWQAAEKTD